MRKSKDEAVWQTGIALILCTVLVIVLLPLWRVFVQSFSPSITTSVPAWGLWFSKGGFSTAAYEQLLTHPAFIDAAFNSFKILVMGVSISLVSTILLSYVLASRTLPGRRLLSGFVMLPFLFNPGLIPAYLVVSGLGLQDKLLAVVLPGAISVYNVFVMRNFFMAFPEELKEAARVDGAGELYILVRLILPLSKPIILTIGLFYGVHFWNEFFTAILYLNDAKLQPLPVLLRNILLAANLNEYVDYNAFSLASVQSIKAASVFLAGLPMFIVYPFIQRYFAKGTLAGGLKG